MSVIASSDEVIKNLAHYLELRNYKNIEVNYAEGVINAERKEFLFGRKNKINLKVIRVADGVTNVELILNPGIKKRSPVEEQLEENLRDKMYNFL